MEEELHPLRGAGPQVRHLEGERLARAHPDGGQEERGHGEGRRVEIERRRADGRDQETGRQRAEDLDRTVGRRDELVGGWQTIRSDELRDDRDPRWIEDGGEDRGQEDEYVDDEQRGPVLEERWDRADQDRARDVADEHGAPVAERIADRAGKEAEHRRRHRRDDDGERGEQRRARGDVRYGRERDERDRIAKTADGLREPEQPEVRAATVHRRMSSTNGTRKPPSAMQTSPMLYAARAIGTAITSASGFRPVASFNVTCSASLGIEPAAAATAPGSTGMPWFRRTTARLSAAPNATRAAPRSRRLAAAPTAVPARAKTYSGTATTGMN